MADTYRAGDADFDVIRSRFYAMVRRHLAEPVSIRKTAATAPSGPGRDGVPIEIEKYGDPRIASYRDNAADALGWLAMKGHMNSRIVGDRTDRLMEIAWAEGRARITTATMLSDLFERAELTALRSANLEGISGGGFGPRAVHHTKLEAMMAVQSIRSDIPPACMAIIEAVISRNQSPWLGQGKAAQAKIFEEIRRAIDFATWSIERSHRRPSIDDEELIRRWPEALDWITARRLVASTEQFRRDIAPPKLDRR